MARGLLWLPLLAVFIGLAWAGWNEYHKLEAYRTWAAQFQRAKYDIYAVLGQSDSDLTWGKPTRKGPVNLQTFSLQQVQKICLIVNGQSVDLESVDLEQLPQPGRNITLEFELVDSANPIRVPFTDVEMAAQWGKHLQKDLQQLQSGAAGQTNSMG